MRTRAIFWATMLAFCTIVLSKVDNQPAHERLGHAIACSERFPFRKHPQAEILEFGLQDVRGIACDREGSRVFLAEGNRSLLIDWLDSGAGTLSGALALPDFEDPDPRTMCPEEPCGVADERGLAILDGKLFSVERGRGQITVTHVPQSRFSGTSEGSAWLLSASPLPGRHESLTEPSGIAAVNNTLFITDEPLRPRRPESNSNGAIDHTGRAEESTAQVSGALYVCAADQCLPETIDGSLRHPSGVAAEKEDGPVFVAETGTHEVRWPVYGRIDGRWAEIRSLGSVPISGERVPPFLGVALDDSRKMVFAAGPGGLFVFDFDGTLLGRVMFDGPVTGVATGGDHVYLAVGNTLSALTLDDSPTSNNSPIVPTSEGPSKAAPPTVEQPRPTPQPLVPISEIPRVKDCPCPTRVKRKVVNPIRERPCPTKAGRSGNHHPADDR